MSVSHTVPPSPARLARARRAGFRARSHWLVLGIWLLGTAAVLEGATEPVRLWAHQFWEAAARGEPGPVPSASIALLLAAPLWMVGVAVGLAHLVVGAIGPISPAARRQLGSVRVAPPVAIPLAGVIAGGAALFLGLRSFVAGAARSVDATGPALADLWQTWFMRGTGQVGLALLALGLVEAWAHRGAIFEALHQTPGDARRERREAHRR